MLRTIPIPHEPVEGDELHRAVPERPGVTVAVPAVADVPFEPDTLSVKGYSLTGDMVATLGFSTFVSSGDASWSYYMYDFLASQTLVTPDPSSPQDATVVGVGFRVVIKAKNVSGRASLSLGGVAAAATVQGAETSLKVAPIGLGAAAFAYLSQLGADPDFDIGTTVVLGQATGELIDFLTDPANLPNLQPRPVAIVMNEQSVETAATSFGFGLRAIQYGDPRSVPQDATPNKLPDGAEISDAVIIAVYHNIVGSDALSTQPSTKQADKAQALTHTGP